MKTATVTLEGISPYSQSRMYEHDAGMERLSKESPEDYRKRTWRSYLHVDAEGFVMIPSMALKNCLSESAKFLNIQIPGKGKATYTKNIEAGVILPQHARLVGVRAEDVAAEHLFLPADGRRGSGKRIWKIYPVIPAGWRAEGVFLVGDDTVTKDVFEQILREAGALIGLGRFRPRNNGFYGRFSVESVKWS